MNTLTEQQITDFACSTLESMAFMVLDPDEGNASAPPTQYARVCYESDEEISEVFLSASFGFLADCNAFAPSCCSCPHHSLLPAFYGNQLRQISIGR